MSVECAVLYMVCKKGPFGDFGKLLSCASKSTFKKANLRCSISEDRGSIQQRKCAISLAEKDRRLVRNSAYCLHEDAIEIKPANIFAKALQMNKRRQQCVSH